MLEITEQQAPASPGRGTRRGAMRFEVQWRNPEREAVDYVAALWAKKHLLLALTLVCGIAGLLYALSKPNTYVSQATLMVHGTGGAGTAVDAAASVLGTGRILPDQVVTAVEIVGSRAVLERVVDRLGPADILAPYEPQRLEQKNGVSDRVTDLMHRLQGWLTPPGMDLSRYSPDTVRSAALETLEQNLSVLPATRGTTIQLSYLHTSPDGAAKVLDAVVEESIRLYGEIVAPPEGKDWLDAEVADASKDEEAARTALQTFADEHASTDLEPEIQTLTESLTDLETQLRLARMKRDEHRQVLIRLREELAHTEPQIRETVQEVFASDPVREDAQQKLLALKVERAAEDQSTSSPPSPIAMKLDREIATLEKQLAELAEVPPQRTVAMRPNPRYTALDADIRSREIDLTGLEVQIPVLEQALADVRKGLEDRGRLQREVERLQDRMKKATAHHDQLREISKTYDINHELDRRGLTNLRVVEGASVPRTKEGPRRGRLLLAAIVAGLMLGTTSILLWVRLDRRLRRGRDVVFSLGRSDVVALPKLHGRTLRRFAEAQRRGWE